MIEILPESLLSENQKTIVTQNKEVIIEKEIEIEKINERIIEKPIVIEKEKIVQIPDGRTNELNKHLVDIIGQIENLKVLVEEKSNKIQPKQNYEIQFNELHKSLNQLPTIISNELKLNDKIQILQETIINNKAEKSKEVIKDYSNEFSALNEKVKLISLNIKELNNTSLSLVVDNILKLVTDVSLRVKEISNIRNLNIKVDEVGNLKELPSAVQFLMSEVKELPYKTEQISKQIFELKKNISEIDIKPEVKIETIENKIDLSNVESKLNEILNEVSKPINFPEQQKLNFGIDDITSIVNEIRLFSLSIKKVLDERNALLLKQTEEVMNANYSTFKNLLKLIPEKSEVEVNVIDNEKVITLLDTINLQTSTIINQIEDSKLLQLEFDSFENLPNPELWKGKTVLVFRVKRKYWFDKKNVLFYSTGFRWVQI